MMSELELPHVGAWRSRWSVWLHLSNVDGAWRRLYPDAIAESRVVPDFSAFPSPPPPISGYRMRYRIRCVAERRSSLKHAEYITVTRSWMWYRYWSS